MHTCVYPCAGMCMCAHGCSLARTLNIKNVKLDLNVVLTCNIVGPRTYALMHTYVHGCKHVRKDTHTCAHPCARMYTCARGCALVRTLNMKNAKVDLNVVFTCKIFGPRTHAHVRARVYTWVRKYKHTCTHPCARMCMCAHGCAFVRTLNIK